MVILASFILAATAVFHVNAAPAPALVPRAATQPCWTTYNTLPGDTCETIATAFRITSIDVRSANSGLNCNDIKPNTAICIYGESQVTVTGIPPAPSSTVSGSGTCWTNYRSQLYDTCTTIGYRFGITPEAVWNANKFLDCNNIWEGTPITICDGARTRTTVEMTPTFTVTPTSILTPTFTVTPTSSTSRSTSAPSATPTTCWTTYISKQGDTCNSISEAFRITATDVLDANTFLNCNDIWVGTPICIFGKSQITVTGIPPSTPTTISGGAVCWTNYRSQLYDTCKSIGFRFGITAEQVYNANKFLNCSDIWEGTPIAICK